LLPEAVAVVSSFEEKNYVLVDGAYVSFLEEYFHTLRSIRTSTSTTTITTSNNDTARSFACTLETAVAIEDFHNIVEEFTAEFIWTGAGENVAGE
jgi:hypothetical protein